MGGGLAVDGLLGGAEIGKVEVASDSKGGVERFEFSRVGVVTSEFVEKSDAGERSSNVRDGATDVAVVETRTFTEFGKFRAQHVKLARDERESGDDGGRVPLPEPVDRFKRYAVGFVKFDVSLKVCVECILGGCFSCLWP